MTTAKKFGDVLAGEKITYSFGGVHQRGGGNRKTIKFTKNGQAFVVKSWHRRSGVNERPEGACLFDALNASKATGECTKHKAYKAKKHSGRHREFEGYIETDATMTVDEERANVRR